MIHSIAPRVTSLDSYRQHPGARDAVDGIQAVHALTAKELERVEQAMQALRQSASAATAADATDDGLLEAYLHIYTNLISALANIEEALQWIEKTGR